MRKLKQIDTRGSAAAPKTATPSDASAKQKIALDFNIADSAITVGVVLLAVDMLFPRQQEARET